MINDFETIGKILLIIILAPLVATAGWVFFIGGPWAPSRKKDFPRIFKILAPKPNDLIYELGCGDGRFCLALAKNHDVRVVGFEVSLLPYLVAKLKIWLSGLGRKINPVRKDGALELATLFEKKIIDITSQPLQRTRFSNGVKIKYKNFYVQDLSEADAIFCYLTPWGLKKLKPKLEKELRPGAKIVSYAYTIDGWQPDLRDRSSKKKVPIYLYIKK